MKILLTGGSGFLGSALTRKLLNHGHHVTIFTRRPSFVHAQYGSEVEVVSSWSSLPVNSTFDAAINLAGEGLADRPWTPARKEVLLASRIGVTEELLRFLKSLDRKPEVLLSGSAVGIYGDRGMSIINEDSPIEISPHDFAQQLCRDWEAAAAPAKALGIRLCYLRSGVVLGRQGGMLRKLLPIYSLGLGGRLGHGDQMLTWVHIDDWTNMVLFLLGDKKCSGAFNLTAPKPVSNIEFAHELGKALHRPAFLPVPEGLLKLVMGEMANMLLCSQLVLPSRLLSHGFQPRYPTLKEALEKETR